MNLGMIVGCTWGLCRENYKDPPPPPPTLPEVSVGGSLSDYLGSFLCMGCRNSGDFWILGDYSRILWEPCVLSRRLYSRIAA